MPIFTPKSIMSITCMAVFLAACGGGGSSSDNMTPEEETPEGETPEEETPEEETPEEETPEEENPVTPVDPEDPSVNALSDTTLTAPVDVVVLSKLGTTTGTYDTTTGMLTSNINDETNGIIDDDLDYVRFGKIGSAIVSETIDTMAIGSATYTGTALLNVTDVAAATVYDGTATATITIDLSDPTGSSLSYTDFEGTQFVGLGTETQVSGGSITMTGITADASGLSAGDAPVATGFGGTDFDGATITLNGRFAGPNAEEIAGTAAADGTGGTMTSTFAGAK